MEKKWYVVNTYSGHESKVKEKLEMRAESMDMKDYIYKVIIPEEKIISIDKNGNEVIKYKKLFPGYVLIQMVMSDDAWYVVRNTPGVTGFIGSSGKGAKPIPLSAKEVEKILGDISEEKEPKREGVIEVGEKIKIITGPFEGMTGVITSINGDEIKADTDIFGQVTEVEVKINEVELA